MPPSLIIPRLKGTRQETFDVGTVRIRDIAGTMSAEDTFGNITYLQSLGFVLYDPVSGYQLSVHPQSGLGANTNLIIPDPDLMTADSLLAFHTNGEGYWTNDVGIGSDGIAFTDPTTPSWTNLNHGSGTYTEDTTNKRMYIREVGDGTGRIRGWYKSAPSTPYVITAHVRYITPVINGHGVCLFFRENATGELHTIDIAYSTAVNQLRVGSNKWTSANALSAGYVSEDIRAIPEYIRIADNGTNRIVSISPDGINWRDVHSVSRTDFLTADQVGLGLRLTASSTIPVTGTFLSWKET